MSRDNTDILLADSSETLVEKSQIGQDHQGQDPLSQERREALHDFWILLKRTPVYARLIAALAKDADMPYRARAMLVVGGAYLVSPIDLVPGVIPVAGQLDDLYVMLVAIRQAIRMVPAEVADRHLERLQLNREILDDDLATIRRLVRVGVATGARWGWKQLAAARTGLTRAWDNRPKGNR